MSDANWAWARPMSIAATTHAAGHHDHAVHHAAAQSTAPVCTSTESTEHALRASGMRRICSRSAGERRPSGRIEPVSRAAVSSDAAGTIVATTTPTVVPGG